MSIDYVIKELNERNEFKLAALLEQIADNSGFEGLSYHERENIPLSEPVFRYGSAAYFSLHRAAKRKEFTTSEKDSWFLKSDIGEYGKYEGNLVPLDFVIKAAEKEQPELNKPKRTPPGSKKKFYVYVKNKKGNIVKVRFGQPGVSVKNDNPKAAKSFRARHRCQECNSDNPKCPKTKARYWSCNVHRYSKQLGLKSNEPW